jgi:hypothetical protein
MAWCKAVKRELDEVNAKKKLVGRPPKRFSAASNATRFKSWDLRREKIRALNAFYGRGDVRGLASATKLVPSGIWQPILRNLVGHWNYRYIDRAGKQLRQAAKDYVNAIEATKSERLKTFERRQQAAKEHRLIVDPSSILQKKSSEKWLLTMYANDNQRRRYLNAWRTYGYFRGE